MVYKNKIPEIVLRHAHFSKFVVVGSLNTGFDLLLYFLLANLLLIYPVWASIISTGLTMCLSFYLNHKYVFRSQKKKRHTALQFILVTMFNVWAVQSLVIAAVYHSLESIVYFEDHIWTLNLVAKLCGVSISFILNFLMYRYIFNQASKEEAPVL